MKKRKKNKLFLLVIILILGLVLLILGNIFLKNIFVNNINNINAKVVQEDNQEKTLADNLKDFFSLNWLFGEDADKKTIEAQSRCGPDKINPIINGLQGLEAKSISPLVNGGNCSVGMCSSDGTWWFVIRDPYSDINSVNFSVPVGCSGYFNLTADVEYETEDCGYSYASIQGCFGNSADCDPICISCTGSMFEWGCSSCVQGSPDCYCSDGPGWRTLYSADTHPCYQYNQYGTCTCIFHNITTNVRIPIDSFQEGDKLNLRIGAGGGTWQTTFQGVRTGDLYNGGGNGNNIKITNVEFVPGPGVCGDENINPNGPDDIEGTDDDEECDPGMHCANGSLCIKLGECSDASCAVRDIKDCWSNCKLKQCGDKFVDLNGTDGIFGTDDDEECDTGKFCADNKTDCTGSPLRCEAIGDETCKTLDIGNCRSNCKIKECGDKIIDLAGIDGIKNNADDETCDPGKFCADKKTNCTNNIQCEKQKGDQECKTRVTKDCGADCKPRCGIPKTGEKLWKDANIPGEDLSSIFSANDDPRGMALAYLKGYVIPDKLEIIIAYNGCCVADSNRQGLINSIKNKVNAYNSDKSINLGNKITLYSIDTSINENSLGFINSLNQLKNANNPWICQEGSLLFIKYEKLQTKIKEKLEQNMANSGGQISNNCDINLMLYSNLIGNAITQSLGAPMPRVDTGNPNSDYIKNIAIDAANIITDQINTVKGVGFSNSINSNLTLFVIPKRDLAKCKFTAQKNPSKTKGFSVYSVRNQNNFSIDGISYFISPHITLNEEATVTINYSYYPLINESEIDTFKSEDDENILNSCTSNLINSVSNTINPEGGIISLSDEMIIEIPFGSLDNITELTITKYSLTDCFLGSSTLEYCGDGTCDSIYGENCINCDSDCKTCTEVDVDTDETPSISNGGSAAGGSGGGGGSGGSTPTKKINNTKTNTNKTTFTSVKNTVNVDSNKENPLSLADKITRSNKLMPVLVGLVIAVLVIGLIVLLFLNINRNPSKKSYKK